VVSFHEWLWTYECHNLKLTDIRGGDSGRPEFEKNHKLWDSANPQVCGKHVM
jgi:hypothetical protein